MEQYSEPSIGLRGFYRTRGERVMAKYETKFYNGKNLKQMLDKAEKDGLIGNAEIVFPEELIEIPEI